MITPEEEEQFLSDLLSVGVDAEKMHGDDLLEIFFLYFEDDALDLFELGAIV